MRGETVYHGCIGPVYLYTLAVNDQYVIAFKSEKTMFIFTMFFIQINVRNHSRILNVDIAKVIAQYLYRTVQVVAMEKKSVSVFRTPDTFAMKKENVFHI